MKLIKQSWELFPQNIYDGSQEGLLKGIYEHIEIAGRNCYQSGQRIAAGTAEKFVAGLIHSDHPAPLEFGWVTLSIPRTNPYYYDLYDFYDHNEFSRCQVSEDTGILGISTNYRVIIENLRESDLQYLTIPDPVYHVPMFSAHLITSRQVMAEITRHRKSGFCIESSRFCNYGNEKFGGELSFIIPPHLEIPECDIPGTLEDKVNQIYEKYRRVDDCGVSRATKEFNWLVRRARNEEDYLTDIREFGLTPQEAAQEIGNPVKTSIYMTAFLDKSGWKHVFNLRSDTALTGKPLPAMVEIMNPIRDYVINNGLML